MAIWQRILRRLHKINAAILGNFGGKDQGIPPDDVKKFEEALKKDGKQADIKIYPGRRARVRKSEQQRRIPGRRCGGRVAAYSEVSE